MTASGDIRVALLTVVPALLAQRTSVSLADVVAAVGGASGSSDYQRIQRAVRALVVAGVLVRQGRRYRRGSRPLDPRVLGVGVEARDDVVTALTQAGGYAYREEVVRRSGVDPDGISALDRAARDDPRVVQGSPIRRVLWSLRDDHLVRTPLDGRWLRVEAQAAALLAGNMEWEIGDKPMSSAARRVGLSLQHARELGVRTRDELLLREGGLREALGEALRSKGGGWWHGIRDAHGDTDGLSLVWALLEEPSEDEPFIVEWLGRDFWLAAERAFHLDAAALSRGAHMPLTGGESLTASRDEGQRRIG